MREYIKWLRGKVGHNLNNFKFFMCMIYIFTELNEMRGFYENCFDS